LIEAYPRLHDFEQMYGDVDRDHGVVYSMTACGRRCRLPFRAAYARRFVVSHKWSSAPQRAH